MSSGANQQSPANLQSELLARSGFQPYRPDERHLHPAGAQFSLDAMSPFGPMPGLAAGMRSLYSNESFSLTDFVLGGLFNPGALSYPDALYFDPRLQSMLRSNPHAALYSQLASPYAAMYGMMPGAPPNLSGLHERMKLEEEHRARIAREEEKARIAREEEKARERERELRENEMREREKREKEMREREQREKEMREREMRELREKEHREREQREKEHREREHREKEIREREKLLQQHHFMQSQRNPYNLLGLFPQMVGLRPPSSMHPGYQMHHSLLGLPLPSQIPTSLSNSFSHHSQSPQGGSSPSPITSSPNMSMMSSASMMAMNHSAHGLPHGMSLFPGNLPPPAHLYSPLAPPSASPSNLSNNSFNHPMMNSASSPQPISRSPSSISTQQSLNLSKNQISTSSQYSNKHVEQRNASESTKPPSTTVVSTPSVATVSVTSMINEKNFKIEIPNISNGNNVKKEPTSGLTKHDAKDLTVVKTEKPKEEKLSPVDDLKPVIIENNDTVDISDNEAIKPEEKSEKKKDDNEIKAEMSPQDFSTPKEADPKEIKAEPDDKQPSPNDNKTIETERIADKKSDASDVKDDEEMKSEDKANKNDESIEDTNSTKPIETSKMSNKK